MTIIVLLLASYIQILSQEISIENRRFNFLYVGLDNPMQISVESTSCDSIILTCDNGKIVGEKCKYTIIPHVPGQAKIYVYRLLASDTIEIGSKIIRVRRLPNPIAKISNHKSGEILREELIHQIGIWAGFEELDINATFPILSFTVIILRGQEAVFIEKNEGGRFSEEVKSGLLKVQPGDKVFFVNLLAMFIEDEIISLNPIEFQIK